MDIKVKLGTKNTKFLDAYLRHDPPLCAVITAHLNHNHSLTAADVIGSVYILHLNHWFAYVHVFAYVDIVINGPVTQFNTNW